MLSKTVQLLEPSYCGSRNVWSWLRNTPVSLSPAKTRTAVGRRFHSDGPDTAKPRLCMSEEWHAGTNNMTCWDDRRRLRNWLEDTGKHSSWRYFGDLPCRLFQTMRAILNRILWLIGSQCRMSRMKTDMLWNLEVRDRTRADAMMMGFKPVLFSNCNPVEHRIAVIQSGYNKRVNENMSRFITQRSTYLSQLSELPEARAAQVSNMFRHGEVLVESNTKIPYRLLEL